MREPNLETDGWCLEDGEARHRASPRTFLIPDREVREGLQFADYVKLIFNIAVVNTPESPVCERMWVVIRERAPGFYFGTLDNEPSSICRSDEFSRGIELPFEPKHIVAVLPANQVTTALAHRPPTRRWPRG